MASPSARTLAACATALVLAGGSFAPALADGKKGGHGKPGGAHGRSGQAAQGGAQGGSGDPAGNNGTVKVDGLAYDEGRDNEPHVTCEFRLTFWGFDAGQTGDVAIAGHAPSGSGSVSSRAGVPLAGSLAYTADDLDLAGLTAHAKQGYHLKVTIATGAPGGVKHKVLWYQPCAPAPVVGGTETETPDTPEAPDTDTPETVTPDTPDTVPAGATVLGTRFERVREAATAPAAPARVLGTTLTRPGGLAFTGSFAAALLAVGAALLALGGTVLVLARRRRLT